MVECHPVRAARAPVMAGDAEPFVPEVLHHLDLVARDLAHRVRRMVFGTGRLAAVAVAAQVGDDDGVPLGQGRRHAVPHQVRLGDPVQ